MAIYHALVTSGFNIFLLELLLLYFASATSIALTGPGNFSLDEVIIRILKSEDEEEIIPSTKPKNSKEVEVKEETIAKTFLRHIVIGGELNPFRRNLFLRAGYSFQRRFDMTIRSYPALVGFSWGVGFSFSNFHFVIHIINQHPF